MESKQEDQFLQYTGITFLGIIILTYFSSGAHAISPFEDSTAANLTRAGGYIASVIIFYLCFRKQLERNNQTQTIQWHPLFSIWEKILVVLLILFLMLFIMEILSIFSITPWNICHADKVTVAEGSIGFIKASFFIAFYAMCEEIMFRRVLLQTQTHNSLGFALISSSVLFALCHCTQVLAVFAAGMALGGVYILTGSIIYPILMHVFNNIFKFYIFDYISPLIPEDRLRLTLLILYGIVFVLLLSICFISKNIRNVFERIKWKTIKTHFKNNTKRYAEFFRSPGTLILILFLFLSKFNQLVSPNSF